jgi:methylmalonyl-CoA mutase N-terminal domain/subunit
VSESKVERGELRSTISGVENEPLYGPDPEFDPGRDLGEPGEYPFTRGVYPSMYRGRLWTMRQFAGFGTAAETNERFRYLLEHGQTGLSTAFDMPTLMGLDSDHTRSEGEVGREGVAGRHADAVRGDPARRGLDVDDDQLAGGDAARLLSPGR